MIASHYLTQADVVAMHGVLCARYGTAPGVRNLPLLQATLALLKEAGHADTIAQAAVLFERLAFGRPFIDGNPLIAFAATDVFLRINGHRIARNAQSLLSDLVNLTRASGAPLRIEPWLRGMVSIQPTIRQEHRP